MHLLRGGGGGKVKKFIGISAPHLLSIGYSRVLGISVCQNTAQWPWENMVDGIFMQPQFCRHRHSHMIRGSLLPSHILSFWNILAEPECGLGQFRDQVISGHFSFFFFFFHFSFIIHMCIQGLVYFSPLPPPPPHFSTLCNFYKKCFTLYCVFYSEHLKKENNYNDFKMQFLDSINILYNYNLNYNLVTLLILSQQIN
jgi:hypothetical protein